MISMDLERKIDKLHGVSYNDGQKLIYDWVLARNITLKEFKKLCEINNAVGNGLRY